MIDQNDLIARFVTLGKMKFLKVRERELNRLKIQQDNAIIRSIKDITSSLEKHREKTQSEISEIQGQQQIMLELMSEENKQEAYKILDQYKKEKERQL
jgi:hypothetical protein